MKSVVLVAPHFLPSFLPSVHRSRLWSYHLEEFGWKPIILTTDPAYYECQVADDLLALLPPSLEVIRTRAIPVKPVRLVGDIALRSLYWYWKALARLAGERRVDFVHFTIPAALASLLGPRFYQRFSIPYGIDYIDPWIPESPLPYRLLSKDWAAHAISRLAEPAALRKARLITGINPAYFESAIRRNPHLRTEAVTAGMPYGSSERDYEALARRPRKTFLFDPEDGNLHLMYAGALLPKAFEILDRLLAAIVLLRDSEPGLAARLRVHFVGTGLYENDSDRGHTVKPLIDRHRVADLVSELPSRIGYLDVLNHLQQSTGVLVIGSTEPHYAPSKIYQAVMSRRPVFVLLHEASTAATTFRGSQAGEMITFREHRLPEATAVARVLGEFLRAAQNFDGKNVEWDVFEGESAKATTRKLAAALDEALALESKLRRTQ